MAIILLTLIIQASHAQDYKSLAHKIQEKGKDAGSIHLVMSVKAFEDEQSSTPFFQQKTDIKKDGMNYSFQNGNNDMLLNQTYFIVVDHTLKEIVCTKRTLEAEKELTGSFQFNTDSLLSLFKLPDFIEKKGNIEHYRATNPQEGIESIDLYINTELLALEKAEYRYSNQQIVQITFETLDLHASFNDKTFDEKKYVLIDKGMAKPTGAYQHYTVFHE